MGWGKLTMPADVTGRLFQSLETNGRSFGSRHRPAQGWGIAPDEARARL